MDAALKFGFSLFEFGVLRELWVHCQQASEDRSHVRSKAHAGHYHKSHASAAVGVTFQRFVLMVPVMPSQRPTTSSDIAKSQVSNQA